MQLLVDIIYGSPTHLYVQKTRNDYWNRSCHIFSFLAATMPAGIDFLRGFQIQMNGPSNTCRRSGP